MVEVEQLAAVSEILTTLGFKDFRVLINHRQVLAGLMQSSGILGHQQATAIVALDKLDKIGYEGVQAELVARGIPDFPAGRLIVLLKDILAPSNNDRLRLATLKQVVASNGYSRMRG